MIAQSKSKSPLLNKKKLHHETVIFENENEMPLKFDATPEKSPNYQSVSLLNIVSYLTNLESSKEQQYNGWHEA